MKRYDQCDETCTTDCGHCKGQGRPTSTTETVWVCGSCYMAIAGYDEKELGYAPTVPFKDDPTVVEVVNDSDPRECDACKADGISWDDGYTDNWEAIEAHGEHDHDSFSLQTCPGCGQTAAGDRYAATITIQED